MRIYAMTATFGKLEHQTLRLEPGLNIISAPNEWGKSTWCAFLVAMLYGLDTRAKSTRTALADKEHYAPWSGSPMEGRIDLNWNGRDITIERRTKRRTPLGEFRAYETDSGLPVEELTAANCGQMLLGVEQSVFTRAGFIRFSDLPVTQDEALRRRLNALVTTGDDSGAADRLAMQLKELKNKCRYNRTGLLPQAQEEREQVRQKLTELDTLEAQSQTVRRQLEDVKTWLSQLYNHQQALAYAQAEENAARVAQARENRDSLMEQLHRQEEICAALPSREEAQSSLQQLRAFQENWLSMQSQTQSLPQEPEQPQLPPPFAGMEEPEAREMVRTDRQSLAEASSGKMPMVLMVVGLLGLAAAVGLIFLQAYGFAAVAGVAALTALIWGVAERLAGKKRRKALLRKYGDGDSSRWEAPLDEYLEELEDYHRQLRQYREASGDAEVRWMVLRKRREALCGQEEPQTLVERWQQAVDAWSCCNALRRETEQASQHYETLRAIVRPVEKPSEPDSLTQTPEQTAQLLTECALEQQRLQNRLGQYQGRMEILGDRQRLLDREQALNGRIAQLEDTDVALTIAQEALKQARLELQRRFAPRITKRAQQLLGRLTQGRYQSLTMDETFTLQTGAEGEDTLRQIFWRSDGTMDQLYLALRLAVAQELTPQAPLVLDDALVRFDDTRLASAMAVLKELGQEQQVLCFTCQDREKKVLAQ